MDEILGIEIPADLSDAALSTDDLLALSESLRTAALAAAEGDVTPDVVAQMRAAVEQREAIAAQVTARAEAEAALAADLQAAMAALADESSDETTDEEDAPEASTDEAEVEEPETVTAAANPYTPVVRAGALAAEAPVVTPDAVIPPRQTGARIEEMLPVGAWRASSGVNGHSAGAAFESVTELADALQGRWQDIAGGGSEKIVVATAKANFPDAQKLTESIEGNVAKFGGRDPLSPAVQRTAEDAITAAICAPREPFYGLGAMSSTERPVRGSMAAYGAPRGGVSVYPTPRLADVDNGDDGNGTGIWTRSDDADDEALKAACAVIPCSNVENYDIYGVYRCMTIKNLMQMTYPELVEAFLNRLAALQARLAEETLLDAMWGSVNTKNVTVTGSGLDASIDLWTTIVNAITVYREEERYPTVPLEFRAHRWLRDAVKVGLLRQRRTSGTISDRIPTDADVDNALRDLGVIPTWTLDYAAAWSPMAAQEADAELVGYPIQADFHLTPRGNFRVLDRGDLNIGVTNNNIYRDNTSNSRNQFTMFFENFEGLIDFGAISYGVTISDFCPNGAQTLDVTAIECTESA